MATPNATLSLGTAVISEGEDFATRELGLPWDMNVGPYPGPTTVFKQDVDLNSIMVSNGKWSFTADGPKPFLWLIWTGILTPQGDDTQEVLKLGDRFPIDTAKYNLISVNLCSDRSDLGIFYWFYTKAPYDTSDPNKTGFSDFFNLDSGCNLYVFDMSVFPKLQGNWSGNPMGLRFNPATQNANGINLDIDWFRITSIDTSNVVPLNWSDATPGADLFFYASSTGCGTDGTLIGSSSNVSATGTFNWGASLQNNAGGMPYPIPESFEPASYFIYALENNTGSPICAASQLEIRKAPLLNFQQPSMFSGPDYATEELGDPWGMANAADVVRTNDLISSTMSSGIFHVTSQADKSWVEVNVGPSIDTNKYKYVTYRMRVEGFQDIGGGWVSRFHWWDIGPGTDPSGTISQIVYEGWHTYSLDLSKAFMLDTNPRDWDGFPNGFRYDPLETSSPMTYHIDFFLLTGDEIINQGAIFEIVYETDPASGLNVTFYYDTDTNPGNGRTPINTINPLPPAGTFRSFLPVIKSGTDGGSGEINLLTGLTKLWDSTGVPAGSYYLSADVSDGVNTTTWYSEVPVIIQ